MLNNGNWKCFSLKDQSVYYGEIAYLKPSGDVVHEDSLTHDEKQHLPKLRHGNGVQLFSTTGQNTLCKYHGEWVKDKRHGKGEIFYPNGDVYKGDFQGDKRHGKGCYTWQDRRKYEGDWKNDRMEGFGFFAYPSAFEVRGEFKANYYIINPDLILNPFNEGEDMKEQIRLQVETRKKNAKILEAQQKQVKIHRLASQNLLLETISTIDKTNRIAAIVTSSQSNLSKEDIIQEIPQMCEIDLRYLVNLKKNEGKERIREYLRSICMEVFVNGGCIFLNMDDSAVKYEELYYPDMQEFFHPASFPATLFRPDIMKKRETWKSFCGDEEVEMSENYFFVLWSKIKFDENLEDQNIVTRFEKKFSKVFSLDSVDLILCHSRTEDEPSHRE